MPYADNNAARALIDGRATWDRVNELLDIVIGREHP